MLNDRLRRVTDLFVEGTELYLGMDEANEAVVVWVNKLNSFEVEEARRDAAVKRGMRIGELTREGSPELAAVMASLNAWDDEKLAENRVNQMSDDLYIQVLDDIDTDPEMREAVDLVRRGSELLADESAGEDDPRRQALGEAQSKYLEAIRKGQEKAQRAALEDIKQLPRKDVVNDFLEAWRNRASLEVFMEERRASELYMALRDCKAAVIERDDKTGRFIYDHSACDHNVRLLVSKNDVRSLPEQVLEKAIEALDSVTVPPRESGNSDAPASSSASLEQPSEPEVSSPSTPAETPLAVPTT